MQRPLFRKMILVIAYLAIIPTGLSAETSKPTIKVGVIAPLTLGNAAMGEDIRHSVEIVAKRFNDRDSAGNRFELIVQDGQCGSGSAATRAANKLLNLDGVRAMVVGCSGEILQAAPLIEKHGIPTVVVYSSHPKVKELGPNIFRVYADSERDVPLLGQKMLEDGRSRIAVLTEELPFSVAIRDILGRQLGKKIVFSSDFREGEQDFRTLLVKVKASKPDALFLNAGAVQTLGALVKQSTELRLGIPFYSFAYASAKSFVDNYGRFSEGLIFLGPPDFREDSEEGRKLLQDYKTQFNTEPNIPFVAATAHDGATALFSALDRAKGNPEITIRYLENYEAQGVLGPISFDRNGDVKSIHYELKTISEDKVVKLNR